MVVGVYDHVATYISSPARRCHGKAWGMTKTAARPLQKDWPRKTPNTKAKRENLRLAHPGASRGDDHMTL